MFSSEWGHAAARLTAVFSKPMSEATRAAWFEELHRFDGADVAAAVEDICRTSERYPSLAALIAAVRVAQRKAAANRPTLTAPPGELPEGAVALVLSQYQPTAVLPGGPAPGEVGGPPADLQITHVVGVLPSSWHGRPTPPHHWAEPAEPELVLPPSVPAALAAFADQLDANRVEGEK